MRSTLIGKALSRRRVVLFVAAFGFVLCVGLGLHYFNHWATTRSTKGLTEAPAPSEIERILLPQGQKRISSDPVAAMESGVMLERVIAAGCIADGTAVPVEEIVRLASVDDVQTSLLAIELLGERYASQELAEATLKAILESRGETLERRTRAAWSLAASGKETVESLGKAYQNQPDARPWIGLALGRAGVEEEQDLEAHLSLPESKRNREEWVCTVSCALRASPANGASRWVTNNGMAMRIEADTTELSVGEELTLYMTILNVSTAQLLYFPDSVMGLALSTNEGEDVGFGVFQQPGSIDFGRPRVARSLQPTGDAFFARRLQIVRDPAPGAVGLYLTSDNIRAPVGDGDYAIRWGIAALLNSTTPTAAVGGGWEWMGSIESPWLDLRIETE